MAARIGFVFALLSLFLRINSTCSSIDIKELLPLKCRIAGIVLVEKKFNYTMAETACQLLGLQLASRTDVQKAWRFGFETCSFGWVSEKFGVISRIQSNEKCGRNQTGVLAWTVPLTHNFSAHCFNASDVRINSCKPGLMVTIPPSTVQPTTVTTLRPTTVSKQLPITASTLLPTTASNLLPTTLPRTLEPQARTTAEPIPPTTLGEPTSQSLLTTPIKTPKEATTPRMTTLPPTEEPTNPPRNQAARQSERIVFGKLPTTLLILALVFFIAAVVLAICYIRKYKSSVFFRKIEEEESVETKVFKETASADNAKEEETSAKEEKPPTSGAGTGRNLEAEV